MSFGTAVRRHNQAGRLVVQPRMGFSDPGLMRDGLLATRRAEAATVGTITVDSYTRVDDLPAITRALRDGVPLNGYPIATHPGPTTRAVLDGIYDETFPVQVRHGSPRPHRIIRALIDRGLDATEGGPVSYCLPYGRTPLADSVRNWRAACELMAEELETPHLETFGGCMLGQLCPPSVLVAISVLEAMFFQQNGVAEVSVSYAQQTHFGQDLEAVAALRRLSAALLHGDDWHVVVYAYMGRYPTTPTGAMTLLARAAELSVLGGARRLIVKTAAESLRIPTIAENVSALEHADTAARLAARAQAPDFAVDGGQVYREALVLVEAVLEQADDIGEAFISAFAQGLLDVPYCLHPSNLGSARARIGADGRLGWVEIGAMPLGGLVERSAGKPLTAADFLASLSYVQRAYDAAALAARPTPLEANSGVEQR